MNYDLIHDFNSGTRHCGTCEGSGKALNNFQPKISKTNPITIDNNLRHEGEIRFLAQLNLI